MKRYRKQCMQEMHERLSFGPKFDAVYELDSGEAFLEVIEKEHRLTLVVVHIYENGVKGTITFYHVFIECFSHIDSWYNFSLIDSRYMNM